MVIKKRVDTVMEGGECNGREQCGGMFSADEGRVFVLGKVEGNGDKKKERVRPQNQRSFVMHASRRRVFFVSLCV
jgi:hypothetical protein